VGEYSEQVKNEWKRQVDELQKANIMIVGGTGVGKSALVNYIFGENVAKEGSGKPITRGMHKYEPKNIPVVLIDTEGYEISENGADVSNFRKNIIPKIEEYQNKELKKQIHIAWYCISISNNRITDFDLENIKIIEEKLSGHCAIVLTQCDNDEEDSNGKGVKAELFKKILYDNNINLNIFEISTNRDLDLKLDFENLISWSSKSLPEEALRLSFIASQKRSIKAKYEVAHKYVLATSASAAATAATPIPFADMPIISGLQIAMAVKIASIFGISSMGDRAVDLLKTQIAATLGKTLAAELTKFIPVLGSLINVSIAGSITYGLGYGLIKTFEKACYDFLEKNEEPDWVKLFSDESLWNNVKRGFDNRKNDEKI
jgi:uncharacterized protein (DUF697 family)/GTP-binding protein EngB required for normal cell division